MTRPYWPHRDIKGQATPIPHVSLASVLTALSDGPKTVEDLAPADPVVAWGNPLRKNQVRHVAAYAMQFARNKGLVSTLGPRVGGNELYALTDKGRKFADVAKGMMRDA
jgi:hypothetical protein